MTIGGSTPGDDFEAERRRIVEAMIDLVLEHGYPQTTVEMVLERAGVDRAQFDRHFAGKEDCFVQIYLAMAERFDQACIAAYLSQTTWRDGLRATAYAAARFVRDNPREIRFGLTGDVGDVAQAHREASVRQSIELVDAGRQELDDPGSITRATAESVAGMVYETVLKFLLHQKGDVTEIEGAVPELMSIAVLPYLGPEAAAEELEIPPPPP